MQFVSRAGGPDAARAAERARRMNPPENEIPCAAALSAVLARTDDVAVGLDGATVFSTGVLFRIIVRRRRDGEPDRPEDLVALAHGGHLPPADGRQLMLGVELADGRRAAMLGDPWFRHLSEDDSLDVALVSRGAGGGGRTYDASYWLTVVPPAGDLRIVCAWPAFGIPETVTVLDAGPLAEAAACVVELWPVEPASADEYEPRPPARPVVAPGGWFEQVLGAPTSDPGPGV